MDDIYRKIAEREQQYSLRTLQIYHQPLIDFFSNDYLGYAKDQELINEIKIELSNLTQLGSTGSRLISGNCYEVEDLEAYLASYYEGESALFYPSGFMANLGFFSVLPAKSDTLIYDEYAHASMREAIRLNPCRSYAYRHNDPEDLVKKISRATGNVWVYLEGLYSMHGDFFDPDALIEIFKKYPFYIIIDEAHSTGTFGKEGKGYFTLLPKEMVFARLHTFGKAMAYHGAVFIVQDIIKKYLINFSKPFIYSTALPKHDYIILKKIHQYHQKKAYHRWSQLYENVRYISLKMDNNPKRTPIIPFYHSKPKLLEQKLKEAGVACKAILPPTVPAEHQMLRIVMHSFNTKHEIDRLLAMLFSLS